MVTIICKAAKPVKCWCGFKKSRGGFTLLELTIALAIVGIVLIPLLSIFTGALFSIFRGGWETRGVIMAQERMEEFKYMGYTFLEEEILAGQKRVTLNDTVGPFHRVVNLEQMDVVPSNGGNGIFSIRPAGESTVLLANVIFIKVSVAWMEGGKEHVASVSSFLAQR